MEGGGLWEKNGQSGDDVGLWLNYATCLSLSQHVIFYVINLEMTAFVSAGKAGAPRSGGGFGRENKNNIVTRGEGLTRLLPH